MTARQAGIYYLSTICPVNDAVNAFNDYAAGKYEYEVDMAKVRKLAERAASMNRDAARSLQNPPLQYPRDVRRAILGVSSDDLAAVTYFSSIAKAKSWAELVDIPLPNARGNRNAQQVRLALNLSMAGKCPTWAKQLRHPTMEKPLPTG